jgi:aspartyl-tRNA(Asn)/glutamyl-tRNA(Gln) amidotransferase subunit C
MTITQDTVEHVAKLARLALMPEEAERYAQDLDKILQLVAQLDALDLSAVSMELSVSEPSVLRPDLGVREFSREELMRNAPNEEDGFFHVPRILGDGNVG